jgi:hypothetical protein
VLTAKAVQHNTDLLLGRVLLARGSPAAGEYSSICVISYHQGDRELVRFAASKAITIESLRRSQGQRFQSQIPNRTTSLNSGRRKLEFPNRKMILLVRMAQ